MTRRDRAPSIVEWQQLADDLRLAARAQTPVLICGHASFGRLAARAIHDRASRGRTARFVDIQPATFDAAVASGALSGHTTGTDYLTVFVSDVDRLSSVAQEWLTTALDTVGRSSPVEHTPGEPVVRVVVATAHDLAARVAAGQFSERLFYRLNVIQILSPAGWVPDETAAHALLSSVLQPDT